MYRFAFVLAYFTRNTQLPGGVRKTGAILRIVDLIIVGVTVVYYERVWRNSIKCYKMMSNFNKNGSGVLFALLQGGEYHFYKGRGYYAPPPLSSYFTNRSTTLPIMRINKNGGS